MTSTNTNPKPTQIPEKQEAPAALPPQNAFPCKIEFTEFQEKIKEGGNFVVQLTAPWDRNYDQQYETILAKVPLDRFRASYLQIDVDDSAYWEQLKAWTLDTIPSLAIISNGEFKGLLQGMRGPEQLEQELHSLFAVRDFPV